MDMHHLNILKCLSVFVRGEFEEGDVVCTTWTMVTIAIGNFNLLSIILSIDFYRLFLKILLGCVVFLVASILVVCVLCIHSQRKRKQQPEIGLYHNSLSS